MDYASNEPILRTLSGNRNSALKLVGCKSVHCECVCVYASLCCTSMCVPLFQSGGPSITIRLKHRAWLTLRNNLIPLKTPLSTTLFFTFPIVGFLRFTLSFSPLLSLSAGFGQQTWADENLPSMSAVIPQTHTCCAMHTQRTQSCSRYIVLTQPLACVCSYHSVSRAECETRASSTFSVLDPKRVKVTRCSKLRLSVILVDFGLKTGLKSFGIRNSH